MILNEKVTEYIENTSSEQIKVLNALRQIIHTTIPETTEEIKWGIPVFKENKIFTYLRCSKNHITMGFYNIQNIKDSKGILEGTGKTMRHIKIKTNDDIDAKLIAGWLKETTV